MSNHRPWKPSRRNVLIAGEFVEIEPSFLDCRFSTDRRARARRAIPASANLARQSFAHHYCCSRPGGDPYFSMHQGLAVLPRNLNSLDWLASLAFD